MVQTNGTITKRPIKEISAAEDFVDDEELDDEELDDEITAESSSELVVNTEDIDHCLNALKTLLSTVEKLQKVRQDVGDIKPLLVRMLDGEVITGEELEQLKTGVGGLFRLVRAYSDHQSALVNAQSARHLLDQVLK
ncbi:hypothetical protein J5X98_24625 [Leptothermofonsia sichuanensis E412]|uniref:hypothetical protein n=1 Tax=Leptothermofonsia sichuanensis TaxID=2917832 RepID=UPI001CA66A5E|nr:hypothetical protein [Leptothermofonsia sichuanensis]QZZ20397.1 hypothetical protein J5X98_24625 [Leptothermofonsia sichuanensis E412]